MNPADDAIDEAIVSAARAEGAADPDRMVPVALGTTSRRGFLRGAPAVAGGTAAAAAIAACAPASGSAWSYAPLRTLTAAAATPEAAIETTEPITDRSEIQEGIPEGWTEHDVAAREKVRRFVGNLAEPLGMSEYLGQPEQDPEFTLVEHGNQPLEPTVDGDWTVFEMFVDQMDWQIDAMKEPVKALGFNKMWPGRRFA